MLFQYFIVKHALSHGVRAEDYRRLASEAASRLSPGEVLEAEARRREGRERERSVPVVLPLSDSLKGSLVRENKNSSAVFTSKYNSRIRCAPKDLDLVHEKQVGFHTSLNMIGVQNRTH